MDVVAQWVRVSWSKASRGQPGAAVRNAAPSAFALPVNSVPLVHEVVLWEETGFAPESSWCVEHPDPRRVRLRAVDGGVRVLPAAGPGAPERRRRPPAVLVGAGQWLRWRLNHCTSSLTGHGDWHYTLETLNLAVAPVAPDVFLGEPTHAVDERARLR